MTPSSNHFPSKIFKKLLPKLNQLNKSRITTASRFKKNNKLSIFICLIVALNFLFLNCGEDSLSLTTPTNSSDTITDSTSSSISKRMGEYCNDVGICFETNTIIGISNDYSVIRNFSHYRYYIITNITYYEAFTSTSNLYSNLIIFSVTTNYYYSNLFTSFDVDNIDFPQGITVYKGLFYITSRLDNEDCYSYNSTGIYQTNFSLYSSNATPTGITTYNDRFYITDTTRRKVYIYNDTGAYLSNFSLHSGNGIPQGIRSYNNKFYISDSIRGDVYIYNDTGTYQTNLTLHSANRNPRGIAVYNDKFYITDNNIRKVYIYNNTLNYQSSFNLHSDSRNSHGITVYNNKFYIADFNNDKVYAYPIQ